MVNRTNKTNKKVAKVTLLALVLQLSAPLWFFLPTPVQAQEGETRIVAVENVKSPALFEAEERFFKVEFGDKGDQTKHRVRFEAIPEISANLPQEATPAAEIEKTLKERPFLEKAEEWVRGVIKREEKLGIEFSLIQASVMDTTEPDENGSQADEGGNLVKSAEASESAAIRLDHQESLSPLQQKIVDSLQAQLEEIASESAEIAEKIDELTGQVAGIVTEARQTYAKTELIEESDKDIIKNVEVAEGIDVEYEVIEGKGVKEEIVLKELEGFEEECLESLMNANGERIATNERMGCSLPKNSFVFNLKLDEGVELHQSLTGTKQRPAGIWYFTDEYGRYLGHFLPPFAKDEKNAKTNNVAIEIIPKSENEYTLIVTVDLGWLLSPERVFPITIDPSIVHDTEAEFDTADSLNRVESIAGPIVETSYHELPADEHTVGLWHMNEGSDNTCSGGEDVCDSSGYGNHGTFNGNAAFTSSSKLGSYAVTLDGTGDYIEDSTNISFYSITIEAWVQGDDFGDGGSSSNEIVTINNGGTTNSFDVYSTGSSASTGAPRFEWGGSTITSSVNIDTGWHYIAATFDEPSGIKKVYVDGIERASGTGSGSVTATTISIGKDTGASAIAWDGIIDEVRILNRARTPEEIKANAQRRPYGVYTSDVLDLTANVTSIDDLQWTENGVQTGDGETLYSSTNLVAQWNFNETSGTTADNAEGTAAYDGTVTNMTTTGQDDAAGDGWTADNKKWGAGALMFDGTDGYVDIGTGPTSVKTVEFWVNPSTTTEYFVNLTSTTDYIWANAGTVTATGFTSPTIYVNGEVSSTIVAGEWQHVVVTTDTAENASNLDIGRTADANYLDGVMDSTRLYSRALGADEILSNYQAGNIEFQTRTGTDTSPDDGSWEAWKPTTSESQILSMDSDADNWEPEASPKWWKFSYRKRKQLTVSTTDAVSSGYTVQFTASDADAADIYNDSLTNGNDFRILYWNGSSWTELDRDLVTFSSSEIDVWFKLQAAISASSSDSNYYAYYDNSGAGTPPADKDNIYRFSDGFPGTTKDLDVWEEFNSGNITQDELIIMGTGGNTDYTTKTFTVAVGQRAKVKVQRTGTGTYAVVSLLLTNDSGGTASRTPNDSYWIEVANQNNQNKVYASGTGAPQVTIYNSDIIINTWYFFEIIRISATSAKMSLFDADGVSMGTPQTISPDSNSDGLYVSFYSGSTGGAGKWDDVQVRDYVATEPTVSAGSEVSYNPLTSADDSTTKIEGSGSMKVQQGAPQVDSSTVALWHLDETNGDLAADDVFDETTNDNDGELYGTAPGPEPVDGIFGKARDFNGSDDYIDFTDQDYFSPSVNDVSVSVWIKVPTSASASGSGSCGSTGRYFVAKGTTNNWEWAFENDNNSLLCFDLWQSTGSNHANVSVSRTMNDGKWHHYAATVDYLNKLTLYIDGAEATNTTSFTGTMSNGTQVVQAGRRGDGNYFTGTIDEISISNVARTAEEIAEAYRAGRDHRLSRTISSTDLSSKTKLPFYVAADRPGTYLEATIGESAYANYEPDSNTKGLWHLEEDSGYCTSSQTGCVKDSSSSGNNGTPGSAPYDVQGKIGKGWMFDGSDDYINISTMGAYTYNQFTISAWYKSTNTSVSDDEYIFIHFDNYGGSPIDGVIFGLTDDTGHVDRVRVGLANNASSLDTYYSVTDVADQQWHHLVMVRTATRVKIYVDGVLESDTADSEAGNSIVVDNTTAYIGDMPSYTEQVDGVLDEVWISDTARTADQIRQVYEVGKRTHPITIDFASTPNAVDIAGTSEANALTDTSFVIADDNMIDDVFVSDTVNVKENYGGTEYIAYGTVTAITTATRTITVASWTGTVPNPGTGVCGGSNTHCFTTGATVFKWQREYFELSDRVLSGHLDGITRITLRVTDGSEGRTFWLDDFKSGGAYLTDGTASSNVTSTAQRYFQYRFFVTSWDTAVTPYISSVTINYSVGPTTDQIMRHGKWFNSSGVLQPYWWQTD